MKKNILFIIVILPIVVFSQTSFNGNEMKFNEFQLSTNTQLSEGLNTNVEEDIRHLRYCIGKYRKEKMTGIYLTLGGLVTAGLATGLYQSGTLDENTASIIYIGGGVMFISGFVMQITCNRWLKKAAIGPADSGIGLKVSF